MFSRGARQRGIYRQKGARLDWRGGRKDGLHRARINFGERLLRELQCTVPGRTFSVLGSRCTKALAGSHVFRRAAQDEQIGQGVDHVDRIEFASHADHQRLLRKLIDDVERAEYPPIVGPILNEVIGPDMVRTLWPQPNTRSVVQPKPPLLWLFLRDFQPLPPPYPFDPFIV